MISKGIYYKDKPIIKAYKGNKVIYSTEFDPLVLFKDGKQGVWYDPSDKSTLFQDVAGTVPVTKDGDPVALMRDKSGNGNHATQSVSTARPLYKTDGILHWLEFDGADDYLIINNLKTTAAFDSFLGIKLTSLKIHVMYGQYLATQRGALFYVRNALEGLSILNGTETIQYNTLITDNNYVFRAVNSEVRQLRSVFVNSVQLPYSTVYEATNVASITTAKFLVGTAESFSNYLHGRMYSMIFVGGEVSDTNVETTEKYIAKKSGVTL